MKSNVNIIILLLMTLVWSCHKSPLGEDNQSHLWETSAPLHQNMKSGQLDSAIATAKSLGYVDALLVIRNGYIVAEAYFNGYDAEQPHNVMSVSKSFLSAITGLALEYGYIDSLGEKMIEYFPEYINSNLDARKYEITIRHLLTMRMGIAGEADNDYGVFQEIYNSDNWLKTTIEYPLSDNPGEKMHYNSFQTHLLSAIITRATNMSTLEFADKFLLKRLGIDIGYWEVGPQGYYFGGSGIYITPQEMAKLGYLYLKEGKINDIQIVPSEWIDFTLTASTNLTHPNEWGAFKNYNYAHLWWLGMIDQHLLFMAYGYGGQFVVVFPDLDLIFVSTAENQVNTESSNQQEWAIFSIISEFILPAVMAD